MKSISTKLAITFIAIFVLAIAAISGILIFISTTSTKSLTLNGVEYRIELQAESLKQELSNRSIVIQSVAEIIAGMDSVNADDIQSVLSPMYDKDENYNIYVGFNDNQAFFADRWEPDSSWIATEREWYADGVKSPGAVSATVPYVDEMTNEICFSMVYGMAKNGQITGVVALDVMQDVLLNVMQDPKHVVEGQYSVLLDKDGNIYYHPNPEYAPSKDGFQNLKTIDSNRFAPVFNLEKGQEYAIIKNLDGHASYYVPVSIEGTDWIVCGVIAASEIEKKMIEQIIFAALASGIALILAIFIIIYVVRKMITAPIKNMVEAARVMASGDLDITINTDADDELGEFGRAFQAIIDDTQSNVKTIQAVASGDLTQDIPIRSEKDVMGLAISDMLDKNNAVMGEILNASGMVSGCSRQIAQISHSVAEGASEQSEAVERLSASIAQIADITRQNLKQSLDTSSLGDEIISEARHGGEQMSDMLQAVKAIDEASRSIGNVIKTIDDIAFQTNILALNAAVEAARAGQHGKGFSVVAEEVRNLATKSAEAAKNTGALISASIERSESGSRLASQASTTFEQIVDKLNLSVEQIKEISDFSEKQVNAINTINDELQSVLHVARQNSESAEETSTAAKEMSSQSNILEQSISQFSLRDSGRTNSAGSNGMRM